MQPTEKIQKHYINVALHELGKIYEVVAEGEKISPLDLLKTTSNLLSYNDINFAIAGGFARSIHATPRATGDVDIVVAVKDRPQVEDLLKAKGFIHTDLLEYSKPNRSIVKFKFKGREIDLIEYSNPEFVDFLLTTSIKHDLFGTSYSFLGLEGVMLTKICSFRFKDKADLIDLLRDTKPDLEIIKSWASKLGVMDRFSFLLENHDEDR